jgi:ParB family chromosome partitioning protein
MIPAYIRIANDESMLEMALVENIQREELDAIEVAISFQRLLDEVHLTQEGLSEKVGKDRATVANYLRLLKLPPEIQLGLRQRQIGMGHAALITIGDPKPSSPDRGKPAFRAPSGGTRP